MRLDAGEWVSERLGFQTWVWDPVLPPWIWYVGALAANSTCFPSKMNLAPHAIGKRTDDGAEDEGRWT